MESPESPAASRISRSIDSYNEGTGYQTGLEAGTYYKKTLKPEAMSEQETQHEAFLAGFADALGLSDPAEIEAHFEAWLESEGLNPLELIDLETCGYLTDLEVGTEYKKNQNN